MADTTKKEDIQNLFGILDDAIQAEDFDEIIKTADRILTEIPGDKDALHCKMQAMINLDRFTDVLAIIETLPAGSFLFHKAYSLYRLQKNEEAFAVLQRIPESERTVAVQHLEAQLATRLQRHDQAAAIYEALYQKEPKNQELQANLLSAIALSGRPQDAVRYLPKNMADSTYEVLYNAACALTGCGDLDTAYAALQTAETICEREAASEGAPSDEVAEELAAIRTQRAFVLQRMGRTAEASAAYAAVLRTKLTDAAVSAVASHNLTSLTALDHGALESLKLMRSATSEAAFAKLTPAQRLHILCSRAILNLHLHKLDPAREALRAAEELDPYAELVAVLKAALANAEKRPARAEEILRADLAQHPAHVETALALAQHHLAQAAAAPHQAPRAFDGARRALSALPGPTRYVPALVALQVALCERVGDVAGGLTVLRAAIDHWEHTPGAAQGVGSPRHTLLCAAARYTLQHALWTDAAALWKLVARADPTDAAAAAALVIAESNIDPIEAEHEAEALPAIGSADAEEIDRIERAEGKRAKKAAEPAPAAAAATPADAAKAGPATAAAAAASEVVTLRRTKAKKAKKRKIRLPANYDPSKPPDPARWLPRREREAKKKGKGPATARSNYQKQTQGSVAVAPVHVAAPKTPEQLRQEQEAKIRAAAQARSGGTSRRRRH